MQSDPPVATIALGDTVAVVALPDAERGWYRGCRFDWAGEVVSLKVGGREVCVSLREPRDPGRHDHATGLVEEFSLEDPPGYAARSGAPFLKLGVGIEASDGQPYHFTHGYAVVDRGAWSSASTATLVRTTQAIASAPWSLTYVKEVEVVGPGVVAIRHRIANAGAAALDLVHYGHGMLRLDDTGIGPRYTVRATGGSLTFAAVVDDAFYRRQPDWTGDIVVERAGGTAVSVGVDRPLLRVDVYAERRAICPEPYVRVHVEPGARTRGPRPGG